jgi:DNA-binding HxlR family transcriptional regulator
MPRGSFDDTCPTRQLIVFLSDRWIPSLMYHLSTSDRRHSELLRLMPDVSQKMLTQTLRKLEVWGVVQRIEGLVARPTVHYRLTEDGSQLNEGLKALCRWAESNEDLVGRLRSRQRSADR